MLGEALEYPRRGENWLERVGIGGGLTLLSFVVPLLPQLVVLGHGKRVLSGTVAGERMPPEFGDWEGLFVDGVKLYAVLLVFALVPAFVLTFVLFFLWFVVFALVGAAGSAGGESAAGAAGLLGSLGFLAVMLISFVLFLAVYYFVPAGMVRYAAEDDLSAAFDLSAIRELVTSGEYFKAWGAAFGLGLGLSVVNLLLVITLVGILAVPFVQFYFQMVVFRMFGRAYADVMGRGGPATATGQPSPTGGTTGTGRDQYERY